MNQPRDSTCPDFPPCQHLPLSHLPTLLSLERIFSEMFSLGAQKRSENLGLEAQCDTQVSTPSSHLLLFAQAIFFWLLFISFSRAYLFHQLPAIPFCQVAKFLASRNRIYFFLGFLLLLPGWQSTSLINLRGCQVDPVAESNFSLD